MKIKYTTCVAGADFCRNPGDVADVDDAEGARLVAAGFAKPVKTTAAKVETATVKPAIIEKATADDVPLQGFTPESTGK